MTDGIPASNRVALLVINKRMTEKDAQTIVMNDEYPASFQNYITLTPGVLGGVASLTPVDRLARFPGLRVVTAGSYVLTARWGDMVLDSEVFGSQLGLGLGLNRVCYCAIVM